MAEEEELLTTEAAARRLGMAPRTLEDWRLRGGGPAFVKVRGSRVRYSPAALAAFVEAWTMTNTGGGRPQS